MSRTVLLGQSATIGIRHVYSGILADVAQMNGVTIHNQSFQPILQIPPQDIRHVGLGAYEITVPSNILTSLGSYYDVWSFVPIAGVSTRFLRFSFEVAQTISEAAPNWNEILNGSTLSEMTACMLKRYYLWPVWSFLQNYCLSDSVLQKHIDAPISYYQRELGIPLRQMRVKTFPYGDEYPQPVYGTDFDEEGHLLQFSAVESTEWSNIRLPHSNIIRMNGLRGVYGGKVVYTIPLAWIDGNEFTNGIVRVRPTTAGLINQLVDNSGMFLENTLLEARGTITVPGFWAADYTYGNKNDKIAKEILDVIMKKSAVTILDQVGMSISRGLSNKSASVDGLSSSISYITNTERSMFSALCASYQQDLAPEQILKMRQFYKGPSVFII